MKTKYKLAIAFVVGSTIAAPAIQDLHAQAKPHAYVVIPIRSIKDAAAFKAGVVDKTMPAEVAKAGGHYVVRTQKVMGLDGKAPERFVIIEFDSIEKAQAWYNSPAQKDINAARDKSTDSLAFIVEGAAK
ncbi:MAG: DUF1330 domain-containing protein [Pseudolabrys sp.]